LQLSEGLPSCTFKVSQKIILKEIAEELYEKFAEEKLLKTNYELLLETPINIEQLKLYCKKTKQDEARFSKKAQFREFVKNHSESNQIEAINGILNNL
jgi:uncharacterized protein YdeI (YjbR/CyaY-like superfamily)